MFRLKKFWNENKDKPLFKGKVFAVFVVILAIFVNIFFADRNSDEAAEKTKPQTVSAAEEKPPPKEKFHIGASNVIVLGGCVIALAAVKYRDNNIRK